MLYYWDLLGVFFFCISGALAGDQKGMDLLGCYILALVTGIGGGTLRCMMVGDTPFVLQDPAYILTAGIATFAALYIPSLWHRYSREVSVLDALGLGIFACIGADVTLNHGFEWWAAAGMGVVTAVFGGVIRDVFRNDVPLVFRKEIYATAALGGALLFMIMLHFGVNKEISMTVGTVSTAVVRLLAIRYAVNQSSF